MGLQNYICWQRLLWYHQVPHQLVPESAVGACSVVLAVEDRQARGLHRVCQQQTHYSARAEINTLNSLIAQHYHQ